ncbi:hypothetical protein [Haloplanus aerogenes]|uniref:Uncharacterized protein n=1 Tax=Haloplanus aerogenes TaxID=660522 RepID=A0A3M0E833_9EURY|nr:hypothetical protein [Haloplanus aerogenes]AZH24333.1 hypothetical protein DU502_02605 [Haloplanus aerogenes]RMB24033.1 hypothetical protein ATH50_1266 [Haloplanus aerogenes]
MVRLLTEDDDNAFGVSSRNRRRLPQATLRRLVSHPPSRLRDRALAADSEVLQAPRETSEVSQAAQATESVPSTPPEPTTFDVACWTPVASAAEPTADPREPRATLLAEPALPGTTSDPVSHTLVLEVDEPTACVELDYRPLDATVVPERGVRVRTDDDRPVTVDTARIGADGIFVVTFAQPPTDGALFLEYSVTQNPDGGQHTVGVVVDGERQTEARLVVVG